MKVTVVSETSQLDKRLNDACIKVHSKLPPVVKALLRGNGLCNGELRGGAIRSILCDKPINDYDVYFDSDADVVQAVSLLKILNKAFTPIQTSTYYKMTILHSTHNEYKGTNVDKQFDIVVHEFPTGNSYTIDLVKGNREEYKTSLDFTINSAYFDGKVIGVLVDPSLFFWMLDYQVLYPMNTSISLPTFTDRYLKMIDKGFRPPNKLTMKELVDLANYLELF